MLALAQHQGAGLVGRVPGMRRQAGNGFIALKKDERTGQTLLLGGAERAALFDLQARANGVFVDAEGELVASPQVDVGQREQVVSGAQGQAVRAGAGHHGVGFGRVHVVNPDRQAVEVNGREGHLRAVVEHEGGKLREPARCCLVVVKQAAFGKQKLVEPQRIEPQPPAPDVPGQKARSWLFGIILKPGRQQKPAARGPARHVRLETGQRRHHG